MEPTHRGLVIVGAGRQGRNINDICTEAGVAVRGFLDDTKAEGETVNDVSVLGGFDRIADRDLLQRSTWIVGLGDNDERCRIAHAIRGAGGTFTSVIHPSCQISPHAQVGEGVFVNAFSRILANTQVRDFVLIEGLTSIGADVVLEEGAFIGPGCHVTGASHIGARAFVGAGAVVLRDGPVGARSVVGAGATVVSPVPDGVTVTGTPARARDDYSRIGNSAPST